MNVVYFNSSLFAGDVIPLTTFVYSRYDYVFLFVECGACYFELTYARNVLVPKYIFFSSAQIPRIFGMTSPAQII